jgi:hypothetical protein
MFGCLTKTIYQEKLTKKLIGILERRRLENAPLMQTSRVKISAILLFLSETIALIWI